MKKQASVTCLWEKNVLSFLFFSLRTGGKWKWTIVRVLCQLRMWRSWTPPSQPRGRTSWKNRAALRCGRGRSTTSKGLRTQHRLDSTQVSYSQGLGSLEPSVLSLFPLSLLTHKLPSVRPKFLTNTISLIFFLCFWGAFSKPHFTTLYNVHLCLVVKILFGLDFRISYPPWLCLPLDSCLESCSLFHSFVFRDCNLFFKLVFSSSYRWAPYCTTCLSCSAYLTLLMKSTALGTWELLRKYISKSSRA